MKLSCGLIFLLALGACGGGGNPPQPPQPPPPPWQCELEMPGCHETGQTCSTPEAPCWHNPTQDPEHCEEAPACPLPQPQCETFTNRGGELQCQSGSCDCYCGSDWIECEPLPPPVRCPVEDQLEADSCAAPQHSEDVKAATTQLGDRTGRPPRESLDLLAVTIRAQTGRCVVSGIEAVFIARDDGLYEENHAVFFGDGSWTNSGWGRFIGCHRAVWDHRDVCPDPGPNLDSMKFTLHDTGNYWDSTFITVGQPEFCASIGYCCMPGTGGNVCGAPGCIARGGCPVWPDGHPNRAACEKELIGAQQWWCDGQPIDYYNRNPAQAQCNGHVKTCTQDGRTCAEADK